MAAPVSPLPDAAELGKAIAELQDFRLIMYVLIVVIIIMVIERGAAAWGMRQERKEMSAERQKMWDVADKFTEAAEEVSKASDKLVVELQVLRAVAARVEQSSGT